MHHHLKRLHSSQRQGELCMVYHKTITDVNKTNSHFAFKTINLFNDTLSSNKLLKTRYKEINIIKIN